MISRLQFLIFCCVYFSVNYKVELHDPRSGGFMPSSPGIGMHVQVKDPDDKTILSRVYSSEGISYCINFITLIRIIIIYLDIC